MLWSPVVGFENYEVSFEGEVRNIKRGTHLKAWQKKPSDQAKIQFFQDGKYYTRSLAKVVAEAWVPFRLYESCDTPINLNGDRLDCRAVNLTWRPLWYARKFHHQRLYPLYLNWDRRFYCEDTNEVFDNPYHCGSVHGLLEEDIFDSLRTGMKVYLLGYRYKYI